jgi:hypothetical protein
VLGSKVSIVGAPITFTLFDCTAKKYMGDTAGPAGSIYNSRGSIVLHYVCGTTVYHLL